MLDLKALLSKILSMFNIHTATVSGSTGALYFYRIGNIVFFSSNGAFRSSASSIANSTILSQTVPSGFRPIATIYNSISHVAQYNARLEFGSNGSITYYSTSHNWTWNAYVNGMWITNDPMPSNWGGVIESIKRFFTSLSSPKDWGWAMC